MKKKPLKNVLPGYKTKITAWILAIIPVLGLLGYKVDPVAVTALIDQWYAIIIAVIGALGASASYFRDLSKDNDG